MYKKASIYLKKLNSEGFWSFYAYETARNMLLGKPSKSINILTNADVLELTRLFPEIEFRTGRTESGFISQNGLEVRFYIIDYPFDKIVHIPGFTDREKLVLRSEAEKVLFRVNAFFYELERDIFIDPLDSYYLLRKGLIKTTKKPKEAIEKYPALALKTLKIYAETGFDIDSHLELFLKSRPSLETYEQMDPEKIEDFISICSSDLVYECFKLMDKWGILERILPEVSSLKMIHQDKDYHPEGDVFNHTLRCLKHLKKPDKNIVMAALLHDTGKAVTRERGTSNIPFPNHSRASKSIARRVLKRLMFSDEDTEIVLYLVENHMLPGSIERFPEHKRRIIFNSPHFPSLLELYRADILSGYHDEKKYYRVAALYRDHLARVKSEKNGFYG